MKTTTDTLLDMVGQLECALAADIAGDERGWCEGVAGALADLAEALYEHEADAASPDGLYAAVDLTRPALARQVAALRREHAHFLEESDLLRRKVREACRAFGNPADRGPLASDIPRPASTVGVPDFGDIRQRARELITALNRHLETEIDLLQESITTDIGAGD
jgi:hypothetical protein